MTTLQQTTELRQANWPLIQLLADCKRDVREAQAVYAKRQNAFQSAGRSLARTTRRCLAALHSVGYFGPKPWACMLLIASTLTSFGQTSPMQAKLAAARQRAIIQQKASALLTTSRAATTFSVRALPAPKVKDKLWWEQRTFVRGAYVPLVLPADGMLFDVERCVKLGAWTLFATTNRPPVQVLTSGFYRVGRHDK